MMIFSDAYRQLLDFCKVRKLILRLHCTFMEKELLGLIETGFLWEMGWHQSDVAKQPIASEGTPLPFTSYAFIHFISQRLDAKMHLFEYGCGNSTLFFSTHMGSVISVEHTDEWTQKIGSIASGNVTINHIPLSPDYALSIARYQQNFDIVFVDGRMRNKCIRHALPKLKPDGVLILDDSDRPSYRQGIDVLISNGFKQLDFRGLGPLSAQSHQTSVFYRKNNILGI